MVFVTFRGTTHGIYSPGGNTSAAGRAAQNHIHKVGCLGDIVGAGKHTTQHNHLQRILGRRVLIGCLPYRGAVAYGDTDVQIAQVVAHHVRIACREAVFQIAVLVRLGLDGV